MRVLESDRGGHVGRARLSPLPRGRGGDGIQSAIGPTGRRGEGAPHTGSGGVVMHMRIPTVMLLVAALTAAATTAWAPPASEPGEPREVLRSRATPGASSRATS